MAIRIYGASDDLVEIEGDVTDEVNPGSSITVGTAAAGVVVKMRYGKRKGAAVWEAVVGQIDEGVPIPWAVTISGLASQGDNRDHPRDYTAIVDIACPPGTPVRHGGKLLNPPQRPQERRGVPA